MATTPKAFSSGTKKPGKKSPSDEQVRKDRITGIIVVAALAALMVLIIWLASLGNGATENIIDHWPMMP
jgi:hypothetical protein